MSNSPLDMYLLIYKKYEPFLAHVAHRSDLSYILANLIGELTIGHSWAGGGALPRVETVPVGLLGADYEVDSGYYKFAKIYSGENWNPGLQAPLTAPGLNVSEGDYLLEVNGVGLIDGGSISSPNLAFYSIDGVWDVENVGVAPVKHPNQYLEH